MAGTRQLPLRYDSSNFEGRSLNLAMTRTQWLVLAVLGGLALAAGIGVYLTGTSHLTLTLRRGPSQPTAAPVLVDQGPLVTARTLAPLATTPDERELATEALRLADQQV